MESRTISELGEIKSLAIALKHFKPGARVLVGSGDDAAVIASSKNYVVTTDSMVEDHDFKNNWSTGFDLGWKAIATNLADVAAMGAVPTAVVVALVVRRDTQVFWLEDFAKGMQAALDVFAPDCAVVGGDLATGDQIVISVTAHGELLDQQAVLRSGAKTGDQVAVAGTLGKAACGLTLLDFSDRSLIESYEEFVEIQLRPKPPIDLGPVALSAGATSMLDVSDGLAKDAGRIALASNKTLSLELKLLQGYLAILEQAAQSLTSRDMPANERDWVLFGGEDHSLLATFPAGVTLPKGFKLIGHVIERTQAGVLLDGQPLSEKGWDSVSD